MFAGNHSSAWPSTPANPPNKHNKWRHYLTVVIVIYTATHLRWTRMDLHMADMGGNHIRSHIHQVAWPAPLRTEETSAKTQSVHMTPAHAFKKRRLRTQGGHGYSTTTGLRHVLLRPKQAPTCQDMRLPSAAPRGFKVST